VFNAKSWNSSKKWFPRLSLLKNTYLPTLAFHQEDWKSGLGEKNNKNKHNTKLPKWVLLSRDVNFPKWVILSRDVK
jgi:hypothetical protein